MHEMLLLFRVTFSNHCEVKLISYFNKIETDLLVLTIKVFRHTQQKELGNKSQHFQKLDSNMLIYVNKKDFC